MRIQKINKRKFHRLLARWEAGKATPNALFYFRDKNKYIAADNTTDNFWVEEFSSLPLCKQWLWGDFEITDMNWEEKEQAKSKCNDS